MRVTRAACCAPGRAACFLMELVAADQSMDVSQLMTPVAAMLAIGLILAVALWVAIAVAKKQKCQ